MALNVLRGLFVLLMAAVGWAFVVAEPHDVGQGLESSRYLALAVSLAIGVLMICIDILSGRRKLAVFSGVAFGILVGLTITYALSFGVVLVVDNLINPSGVSGNANKALSSFINLMIGTAACYFAVSFLIQTKDDFRFIIPYVEFRRDARGARPIVLDTSVLIDGRIAEVASAGFFDSQLIVPQFVILELQEIADHPDRLKRARGRRGLDILARLKRDPKLDVRIFDAAAVDDTDTPVDQRLVNLALELDGRAMTTDYNLNKVAQLAGVPVLNLNELANALKPEVLPGETMTVEIVRPGSGEDQGIGYLDDGTMVVVERGRGRINDQVDLVVTNTTQTAAGRMIFGRVTGTRDGAAASAAAQGDPAAPTAPNGGAENDAPGNGHTRAGARRRRRTPDAAAAAPSGDEAAAEPSGSPDESAMGEARPDHESASAR